MEKFYKNFRYPLKFTFLIVFGVISLFCLKSQAKNIDSTSTTCRFPTYTTRNTDVSSPTTNDGRLLITNINYATHYEIIEGTNTPFDFAQSIALAPFQKEIEIKNISNPTGKKTYRVRLYNENEECHTDATIIFEHMNFALDRDYTTLEMIQAVDNSKPQLDELVTFTTIIQNKGTKTSESIEVRLIQSLNLETVNFYTEKGQYTSVGNIWKVGTLEGGKSVKLVLRLKVKSTGLNYLSSYIAQEGDRIYDYSDAQASGITGGKRSGTSCVTVPIAINSSEVYSIVLKEYKGIKWYYKDASGNFSEINDRTNPALAVINPDSSLTVKQGGEFSFSKKVGDCNISSCCPIIVESCSGPPIVVDSVYCNTTVDSYNILVHLENDKYSLIEKVFYAMSNLNFPVLTNYLSRINTLPLTSSSGFVTSLGNSSYRIENVPAFMPNVTLVSSDLTGKCRNVRIVNAPNCTTKPLGMPVLDQTTQFVNENQFPPAFLVVTKEAGAEVVWFADELATKEIRTGKKFRAKVPGTYYVAFRDKKTNTVGPTVKAYLKELAVEKPGKFAGEDVCGCDNPLMVPQGDLGDLSIANAYPNPVSDLLTVEYRVPNTAIKAALNFSNINGKQMKYLELSKTSNFVKIETNRWVDGTYFYSLIVDGIRTTSQKIVVSHQ
ncbi:T9SS type A sorting domain-containing protein [Lacihabitans sp. LS3-19]|uniref:T9SS type A sorting domain-containing protein n=1 Tax=Lacihabitans sp. LS3-19 TaxID=2487335 RepID=UPI0020CE4081|nr:T9SS type A sorting domain-containing protein [Lacihabitans sp. LS3-19]